MSAAMGSFSKGVKSEFETAVVNEPSVFDVLLYFYFWSFRQKENARKTASEVNFVWGTRWCEYMEYMDYAVRYLRGE